MAHSFPADWKSGFVMDPQKKQRFGYLTAFNGIGLAAALASDLTVFTPYNSASAPAYTGVKPANGQVSVVGVIENISWQGGVGDAISVSAYISSENANLIKALKSMTLKTTSVTSIGFWVSNFDEEVKAWFEEFYPKAPALFTGQINAVSKTDVRLHVADEPVKVAPNIEVNVYNVYMELVPAANQTATFSVATSPTKVVVKNWGLVVGTLAKAAVAPTS
jgi:hypothetical protein